MAGMSGPGPSSRMAAGSISAFVVGGQAVWERLTGVEAAVRGTKVEVETGGAVESTVGSAVNVDVGWIGGAASWDWLQAVRMSSRGISRSSAAR